MSNISPHYYPANVKTTIPLEKVTIEQFIKANRSPKEYGRELFKKIQILEEKEKYVKFRTENSIYELFKLN